MRWQQLSLLVLLAWIPNGCGSQPKLNRDTIKDKIQALNMIDLQDEQIEVGKVSFSGKKQAVAEVSVQLAFHFSKSKSGEWGVDSIRMGDRDWIAIKDFQAALNEIRGRNTMDNLQKLRQAMERYHEKNGSYPDAPNLAKLLDVLYPTYVSEPIRFDGWNHELVYVRPTQNTWKIVSSGVDSIPGNADDLSVGP
ncbi:MAG: type II secretion system protein GspG [Terriglobia bacterium]